MIETLIVDGYNIIHTIPELENELNKDLMSARRALTEVLRRYQARERSIKKIYVIYDGKGSGEDIEDLGLIKNIYTPRHSDADKEIVRLLKNASNPKRIAVLSRDNFVINHIRAMGAVVLSPDAFTKKLHKTKKINSASGLKETEKEDINRELRKIWGVE